MEKFFKNAVLNIIDDMDKNDKIVLYNEYCEHNNDYDSRLNTYDEIDDIFSDLTPTQIVDKFSGVTVGYNDYWYFNGYGNVEAMKNIDDLLDKHNIAYSILEGDSYTSVSDYCELYVVQQLNENIDYICDEITDKLNNDEININKLPLKEFEEIAEEIINDNIDGYEFIEDFIETLYYYILSKFN